MKKVEVTRVGDRVTIRLSGQKFSGVVCLVNRDMCTVRLDVSNEKVEVRNKRLTNRSAAARKAWETMRNKKGKEKSSKPRLQLDSGVQEHAPVFDSQDAARSLTHQLRQHWSPEMANRLARSTRDLFVQQRILEGNWRPEVVPSGIVGLSRDLTILRASRKSNLIKHDWHGDAQTFCPPMWWDMAIGSGACGLQCRSCFLMLTFRAMRDPRMPIVYENVDDYWRDAAQWLHDPIRRPQHTLGLGIDCSDSLLYEGITGHARNLIPMFADVERNPKGCRLVLLTKSRNTQHLEGLPTANIAVTFSLNPETIADLWEGKWPDTQERITPSISERLAACKQAQDFNFEVRWRLDPILDPHGWEAIYDDFFRQAADMHLRPRYVTLGTYRQKSDQLDVWREKWGVLPMEWKSEKLVRDGTHYHVPDVERIKVYEVIRGLCHRYFPEARVSLCKESHVVRKVLGLCNADCNCLR